MTDAVRTTSAEFRLVLWAAHEVAPRGYLYSVNAGPTSAPLFWFEPLPYQPIPRAEPGAPVQAIGIVAAGAPAELVAPDGSIIRSAGKVHRGEGAPLFAERYSGAVHPSFESRQANWQKSPPIPSTVAEWDDHIRSLYRKSRRSLIGGGVSIVVALGVVAVAVLRTHGDVGFRSYYYFGGGGSGVGALASYRRARRARSVADEAHANRDRRPARMYMRLRWTIGDGWGRVPVASLASAPAAEPIAHIPLATIPKGYQPPDDTAVDVYGDVLSGEPAVVRDGMIELWPAETAMLVLHGHRRGHNGERVAAD